MSAILARGHSATMRLTLTWLTALPFLAGHAAAAEVVATAPQWQEVELTFTAMRDTANPYTDTDDWADFAHDDGTVIRRPMFWDGGRTFRVRFTSTKPSGTWRWTTSDRDGDLGLKGKSGTLAAQPAASGSATIFTRHGFWSIPPGGRNLIHADGKARLLCADTAWALPWRATVEQAEIYARDRQAKGFNAALLMTVQPDMDCQGPRSRTEDLGFDVGFEDLPKGTLRQLRPEYFQMFDRLTGILVAHGIAPVYQPVFHGYGWKGRRVADMWRNIPFKAVANGEPTYENIGQTGRGAGWWQGHEAWCNLTAGGTMGLVYGAGSLWQWRLHANEPDHADWCTAPGAGWREALDFEGSRYPGIAAKIFDGLPFAEMQPNWIYTYGGRGLTVPGKFFVLYLPEGGGTGITSLDVPRAYRIYDPRTGAEVGKGRLPDKAPVQFNSDSSGEPRVIVFAAATPVTP